jgi:hypothetical protein
VSVPITGCIISRAARGDELAFKRLVDDLAYNIGKGHFSTWPCEHSPPCPQPTMQQMTTLEDRLATALNKN